MTDIDQAIETIRRWEAEATLDPALQGHEREVTQARDNLAALGRNCILRCMEALKAPASCVNCGHEHYGKSCATTFEVRGCSEGPIRSNPCNCKSFYSYRNAALALVAQQVEELKRL